MENFNNKYPFLKKEDALLLDKAVNEIKKIKDVVGIVQIGSSTRSKEYHDIDVIIFFDSFLVPPELDKIRDKYKGTKLYLQGSSIYYKGFNPGFKVFVKFFSNIKNKNILYGKDPFTNKNVSINKTNVGAYIWYHWHIAEQYQTAYDAALPNCMNAMLAYVNKSPESKEQTFEFFIKNFPSLAKKLPKNPKRYLRGTTKSNFKNLYPFFENCLRYFGK